jgi:hypothetical protein
MLNGARSNDCALKDEVPVKILLLLAPNLCEGCGVVVDGRGIVMSCVLKILFFP